MGGVDSNEAGGDSDDGGCDACDACREDFGCCTGVLVLVASSIIINLSLSLSPSHIYSFLGLSFLIRILGKQSTFHHFFLASASIAQRDGAGDLNPNMYGSLRRIRATRLGMLETGFETHRHVRYSRAC